MDSPTYIAQAVRTESVPAQLIINQRAFDQVLTVLINMARLADLVKRRLYYGQPMDPAKVQALSASMASELQSLCRLAGHSGDAINDRLEGENGVPRELDAIPVRLLHCALGCYTESGEMLEALAAPYVGGQLDLVNFGEEVGDIEWYQAIGFDASGVTEASCREANIAKLRRRYPEKFTELDAVQRDLPVEREALESMGARPQTALEANPPVIITGNCA
jgi:hypothetical protein